MTASRPSYPRLISAALCLVACGTSIAGAQTPIPQRAESRVVGVGGSAIAEQTHELIQKLMTDHYPLVMQGASPLNRITFVLDADGNYVTSAAWTDTAMLRRSAAAARTPDAGVPVAQSVSANGGSEVRMLVGGGVPGGGGRTVPAAGTSDVRDFGAYGFPNITSDTVMSTQSVRTFGPNALSVFIIRLKK